MKVSRNIALMLICIILGVMISWQYKSINFNQSVSSVQSKRLEELKDELIRLQDSNSELRDRLKELQEENNSYESARAGDSIAAKNLQKELETARTFAGMNDVKGKGLIITLDDGELLDVSDSEILDIINELRASDAQAISVNDERIVAMSEIRSAPPYVMINGMQLTAPFTIKAIGDSETMEHSLKILNGVIEKLEGYQFKVTVKPADSITIPKVRDDGSVIKTDLLTPVLPK
jgi:uncharacterized protein YlxW (UPF0749 family)